MGNGGRLEMPHVMSDLFRFKFISQSFNILFVFFCDNLFCSFCIKLAGVLTSMLSGIQSRNFINCKAEDICNIANIIIKRFKTSNKINMFCWEKFCLQSDMSVTVCQVLAINPIYKINRFTDILV